MLLYFGTTSKFTEYSINIWKDKYNIDKQHKSKFVEYVLWMLVYNVFLNPPIPHYLAVE